MALSHLYLGLALLTQDEYKQANTHYRKSLALSHEIGNRVDS